MTHGHHEVQVEAEAERYAGWSILELMGHRRLAGYVTEVELAGQGMWRLDVPRDPAPAEDSDEGAPADVLATQFYSPAAVYCLTPTTEKQARAIADSSRPKPAARWELEPGPEDDEEGGPF